MEKKNDKKFNWKKAAVIGGIFAAGVAVGVAGDKAYIKVMFKKHYQDKSATWNQFIADPVKVEAVKAYVAVKVRLLGFDVPQSSVTKEALQNTASEMEWRLNVEHDHPEE